jgi:uncharacterized membrane protein AbrB (regulator of aidB expression)
MHDSIDFQMRLLLAIALAGHLVSGLVRQPAVVGQFLAGLIVRRSMFALTLEQSFSFRWVCWLICACRVSLRSSSHQLSQSLRFSPSLLVVG